MEQFRFNGSAAITHLNTRKEGPDDYKVLAVDLKLQALVSIGVIDFFEPSLRTLWLDSGAVTNAMINPITFAHELEHYRLDIASGSHFGCAVKKFSIEPRDGGKAMLCFQVSFKPSADEVAQLAEYLQDKISLSLEPESGDLLRQTQQ